MHVEKSKEASVFLIPENSSVELNFQSYHFEKESAVFIPQGQFIRAEQATDQISVNTKSPNDYRYLFSQVLTLGHVDADEKIKSTTTDDVLDYSNKKWKKINPFNTTDEELEMLFDTSDWLDQHAAAAIDLRSELLSYKEIQKLSKEKLHLSLFQWKNHKLINQARQTLYESGGSVKETTYRLGFKDASYFCRFFKKTTSLSPGEFIRMIEDKPQEKRILEGFKSLLDHYVHLEHQVSFYANQLNLSAKRFSQIIKSISGISAKKHIEEALISESKFLLKEGYSVSSIAFELGFEEINHFSNFFKTHTGQSPSEFLVKSTNH